MLPEPVAAATAAPESAVVTAEQGVNTTEPPARLRVGTASKGYVYTCLA